jgi:hypothetical protein
MNGYAGRCSLEVCVIRRKAKARCVGGWGAWGAPRIAPRDESATLRDPVNERCLTVQVRYGVTGHTTGVTFTVTTAHRPQSMPADSPSLHRKSSYLNKARGRFFYFLVFTRPVSASPSSIRRPGSRGTGTGGVFLPVPVPVPWFHGLAHRARVYGRVRAVPPKKCRPSAHRQQL